MKKVLIGWIGKENVQPMISEPMDGFPKVKEVRLDKVYENKGLKSEWEENDWPPRKIKITIEELDETK
jgi:hypothetical protein